MSEIPRTSGEPTEPIEIMSAQFEKIKSEASAFTETYLDQEQTSDTYEGSDLQARRVGKYHEKIGLGTVIMGGDGRPTAAIEVNAGYHLDGEGYAKLGEEHRKHSETALYIHTVLGGNHPVGQRFAEMFGLDGQGCEAEVMCNSTRLELYWYDAEGQSKTLMFEPAEMTPEIAEATSQLIELASGVLQDEERPFDVTKRFIS